MMNDCIRHPVKTKITLIKTSNHDTDAVIKDTHLARSETTSSGHRLLNDTHIRLFLNDIRKRGKKKIAAIVGKH